MKKFVKRGLLPMLAILAALPMSGQGTLEDFNRAFDAPKRFGAKNVYYSNVRPSWLKGKPAFRYVRETPQGRKYVIVDAKSKKRTDLFNHAKLAGALSSKTGNRVSPDSLYLQHLWVPPPMPTL